MSEEGDKPITDRTRSDSECTGIDEELLRTSLAKKGINADEMQIQTMFKMVEDLTVNIGGRQVSKKVLYLTNKQATLINDEAMDRCIKALDIGEPKFIIKLCSSPGVKSQMFEAHKEREGSQYTLFNNDKGCMSSELNARDERIVESQVLLFMKTCIIPLARQTRALILIAGANDCYLGAALSDVALSEQAKEINCPFTVLATLGENEVHYKAVMTSEKDSLAAKIVRGSDAWAKRIKFTHKFSQKSDGESVERCDMSPAASRYVIFEGIDINDEGDVGEGYDESPQMQFEAIFLKHLADKYPSIAIQSSMIGTPISYLVDLIGKNIPILFLDSTERAITLQRSFKSSEVPVTSLANASDAFPSISKEQLQRITTFDDGSVSLDGRNELMTIAETMIKSKWKCLTDNKVTDALNASMIAFFHSALHLGVQSNDRSQVGKSSQLYCRINELEKLERMNEDSQLGQIPNELATRAINFIETQDKKLKWISRVAVVTDWLERNNTKEGIPNGELQHLSDDELQHLIRTAKKYQSDHQLQVNERSDRLSIIPADWYDLFDLITSTHTYSGSIFDIDQLKKTLGSVARIDRLPAANSLEALRILRNAWDCFELYGMAATRYKFIAKLTYIMFIVLGIAITAFVLTEVVYGFTSRLIVLILSLAGGALSSYVTFANPAVKWQQLRMAANVIESNIWTFRTRAGTYRSTGESHSEQLAEKQLIDLILEVKSTILEGADVKTTSFYSGKKLFHKYGQRAPPKANFRTYYSKIFPVTSKEQENEKLEEGFKHVDNPRMISLVERDDFMAFLMARNKIFHYNKKLIETRAEKNIKEAEGDLGLFDQLGVKSGDFQEKEIKTTEDVISMGISNALDEIPFFNEKLKNKTALYSADKEEKCDDIFLHDIVDWLSMSQNGILELESTDSHYEPLRPDAYIIHRVEKALVFYKNRIPRYNMIRNITQLLLVIGSLGSTALAFADKVIWAAAIAICSSGIIAYLEFNGINDKINRYSFTVHALEELIFWWFTLTSIERSAVANVDRLVLTCEELLQKEQHAWKSTSQTVRLLQKASKEASAGHKDD